MLSLCAGPVIAAPLRVAILPFQVNAQTDVTFLQEAILDMLGSRLAWPGHVAVIGKTETRSAATDIADAAEDHQVLAAAERLAADFVLTGSLTVLGSSVSIDAKMIDVRGQRPCLPFFAQTGSMDEVIPRINHFASSINATVFHRTVDRQATAPTRTANAHPETMHTSGLQHGPQGAPSPGPAPNPAFIATEPTIGTGETRAPFWKSRSIRATITGLAVCDLDGDGQNEVVVVSENRVSLYRMSASRLVKTADLAQSDAEVYISADAADIDSDGTPEIYITALGPGRTTVASFAMAYIAGTYQRKSAPDNWYYRVVRTIDRGHILLGQRQRSGDSSIFAGAIHEMHWDGDRLVPGVQRLPSGKANLMGIAVDDITRNGQDIIAAYSDWDRVRLFGQGGELVWEDSDRSGGSTSYFKLPKIEPGQENRQYFPLRIRTADIDRNGRVETLVVHHDELAGNLLQHFRSFSKARIESLEWDGFGLVSRWKTPTVGGRISDFAISDFDNDETPELVIAVVSREGSGAMAEAISCLIAFDLSSP